MCCVISTTATPAAASSRTRSSTSARPAGSSIEVGSSSTRTVGSRTSTPASARRCFCPPDSRWGSVPASAVNPRAARASRHPSMHLLPGNPQILEAEGHVILDRGADDLVFGILEEQADAGADLPQTTRGPTSTAPRRALRRPRAQEGRWQGARGCSCPSRCRPPRPAPHQRPLPGRCHRARAPCRPDTGSRPHASEAPGPYRPRRSMYCLGALASRPSRPAHVVARRRPSPDGSV